MPRKIKVVDVIHEIDIDDTVQPIDIDSEKPFEPIEEDIKKTIEPIEEDIKKTIETGNIKEEQQIAIIPDTKVRTNELHSCKKCGKFMTLKTLKYTHENTCSVGRIPEPPTKPVTQHKKKGRPKIVKIQEQEEEEEEEEIEEIPVYEPKVHVYEPPVRKSIQTIRNERLKQSVQNRTQRISNLFSQAF